MADIYENSGVRVASDDFRDMFRRGAFDDIVYNIFRFDFAGAGEDKAAEAMDVFGRVFWTSESVRLLSPESLEAVRKWAREGSSAGLFAYGRCLCVLRPDSGWGESSVECFRKAAEAGNNDARVALSDAFLYGDLGYVDYGKAGRYLREAYEAGSPYALWRSFRQMLYGSRIMAQDVAAVGRMASQLVEMYPDDPFWHYLRGSAVAEQEGVTRAKDDYGFAAENGLVLAWPEFVIASSCNDEYHVVDERKYRELSERGAEAGSSLCRLTLLDADRPDSSSADYWTGLKRYVEGMEKLAASGCELASISLGDMYRDGEFGIEKDPAKAYSWYALAAKLGWADAFERLYCLLRDGLVETDQDFMDMCALRCTRLGSDALVKETVDIYRAGRLAPFASEIEQYYLPEVEEQEDGYPDDDGRYDAYV